MLPVTCLSQRMLFCNLLNLIFSRNVAQYFPNSLASHIVLSYHTHSPGEISQKWKSVPQSFYTTIFHLFVSDPSTSRRVRRFTLTSLLFILLQQLGSLNPTVQRLILHISQPIIFGGIFLVLLLMSSYPLSFLGLAFVVCCVVILAVRSINEDKADQVVVDRENVYPEESKSQVVPYIEFGDDSKLECSELCPSPSHLERSRSYSFDQENSRLSDELTRDGQLFAISEPNFGSYESSILEESQELQTSMSPSSGPEEIFFEESSDDPLDSSFQSNNLQSSESDLSDNTSSSSESAEVEIIEKIII